MNNLLAQIGSISEQVFVASHRRSGTHLTLDSLVTNFDEFKAGFGNFDSQTNSPNQLFKTHLDGSQAANVIPDGSKIIYVVRDGRDVLVSLYKYAKSNDSKIQEMNFSDFIRSPNVYDCSKDAQGMNRVEFWNFHVQSWLKQGTFPTKLVTFDGWKNAFEQTLIELEEFLKLDAVDRPKSMVMRPGLFWLKKLQAKLGLSKSTAIQFRGGRSEVWREYFTPEDLAYFESESHLTNDLVFEILRSNSVEVVSELSENTSTQTTVSN